MQKYVVDVNVLFSALISGKESYLKMFSEFQFLIPDFALHELQKYQLKILGKTNLDKQTLQDFTLSLFEHLTVVPNLLISNQSYLRAFELCKDIDEKDLTYIALAIELNLTFITKDQVLVERLRKKGFKQVIFYSDFLDGLEATSFEY